MFKHESNNTPKFLAVSDGVTTALPTVILWMFSLDTCLGVPIIKNSVLLSCDSSHIKCTTTTATTSTTTTTTTSTTTTTVLELLL